MVITRYNETIDARATTLKNNIGAINTVVGVNFSHPSGVIRLNDFTQFTHFTATFEGTTYVYKITNWSAINNGVCELTYDLDYMKSWFLNRGIASLYNTGAKVARCTKKALWNKYITDPKSIITGETSFDTIGLQNDSFNYSKGRYVIVVNYPFNASWGGRSGCPHAIMFLDSAEFEKFCKVMYDIQGAAMTKQISKAYYCPFAPNVSGNYKDGGNVKYFELDVKEEEPEDTKDAIWKGILSFKRGLIGEYNVVNFTNTKGDITPVADKYAYAGGVVNNGIIRYSMNLGSITCEDFRKVDYKSYFLQIPYYGTIELPIRKMINYDTGVVDLSITFLLNAIDGEFTFMFNSVGETYPYVPLPSISLPSGDAALSINSVNTNYANTQTSAFINGLFGAFSESSIKPTTITKTTEPIQTGGAIGGLGNAVGTGVRMLTNELNMVYTMNNIAKSGGGFTGVSSGWAGFTYNRFVLFSSTVELYEYEKNCSNYLGYPVNKFVEDAVPDSGDRVWLDMENARLNGLDWFVRGVKVDLGSDYIYYNK